MIGRQLSRSRFLSVASPLLAALSAALFLGCDGDRSGGAVALEDDPLASLGYRVTSGAVPGYVDDAVCRDCHEEISDAYREVGMFRSLYRPRPEILVEAFDAEPFFHEPSGRYYEMRRDGEGILFRRFQIAGDGEPINVFETGVDWIIGSGNHVRSYLYRTEPGEMYQLPISWYSRTGEWGMSPGFELADHFGVNRRVRQECMFCHNAYPEVAADEGDSRGLQLFPDELPEGTGCQRCHGPGAEHARKALGGEKNYPAIRAAIVNPAKLDPRRSSDVCYQCHLQPSIVLTSVRRFDRGVYSFRPGDDLAQYRVALDPLMEGEDRSHRFEINHHPYRLEQSKCFSESGGALNCLTCHDPHRKVRPMERAAHYRNACAGCHDLEDAAFVEAHARESTPPAESDCTSCHMPERRTQDVVLVTMTDHLIRRLPGGPELIAPRQPETDPRFVGVDLVYPERGPEGLEGSVYRAVGTLRSDANAVAVDFLVQALPQLENFEADAWLDLAQAQLSLRRFADAERTLLTVLSTRSDHALARESLGVARLMAGERDSAVEQLRRAVALNPLRPETHYNLGLAQIDASPRKALAALETAIERRPNYAAAWFYSGRALRALGRLDEAEARFRRLLELEPRHARGYVALAALLDETGREAEALRYLHHGVRFADSPVSVREALRARGS